MCGILGFVGASTDQNRLLVKALMAQLSLRGTHATGAAWINTRGDLMSRSKPGNAVDFFNGFNEYTLPKMIRLIGHTRYSTSDLAWNQPITYGEVSMALVMNGVLSQETPDKWPRSRRIYLTKNDAEIAFHRSLEGHIGDMNGSFAVCELNKSQLLCYRNGQRPLYVGTGDDYRCVASTHDALERCGVHVVGLIEPGLIVDLVSDTNWWNFDKSEDLQLGKPRVNVFSFGKPFDNLICSI